MKYSFGKTKAAEKLETLLDNKPWIRRRISSMLSNYTSQLLKIVGAKDPDTVRRCMELLKDYTLARVDKKQNVPQIICDLTKNVIIYRYRVYRDCFDELVPLIVLVEKAEKKGLTNCEDGV